MPGHSPVALAAYEGPSTVIDAFRKELLERTLNGEFVITTTFCVLLSRHLSEEEKAAVRSELATAFEGDDEVDVLIVALIDRQRAMQGLTSGGGDCDAHDELPPGTSIVITYRNDVSTRIAEAVKALQS